MNVAALISKKRDGRPLEDSEIESLIDGYSNGRIPDYQMAAFAMAVYFQGMDLDETTCLTQSMIRSGDQLTWPAEIPSVDKHSTGGIGDKISIPLAPLLACCGVQVPMISGRGLGATGGTLDKLESIPGYRCELSNEEFKNIVSEVGCSIAGASSRLAPADKRLYALRDVTGTVPSIPLITASILSKKIAEGIQALILDVKWGTGAFMKTLEQAQKLARSLVAVGNQLNVKTSAIITDMNQPLGKMIGNAVEVDESVDVLQGHGPPDVVELTLELGAQLLVNAGACSNLSDANVRMRSAIDDGTALQKLRTMVSLHGGDLDAKRVRGKPHIVKAHRRGFVCRIDGDQIGLAVIEMKGGRKKLGDVLDHSTGIEFLVRIGEKIEPGQPLANVFADSNPELAMEMITNSIEIGDEEKETPSLVVTKL